MAAVPPCDPKLFARKALRFPEALISGGGLGFNAVVTADAAAVHDPLGRRATLPAAPRAGLAAMPPAEAAARRAD